ncbi:hypothetical protein D5H78_03850 [Vallicoccus soli]|uniref:Uncharacterized protein n=1 Tax=Vallicoccus soli TaxID=2339232 RepID=A0A3A3ZNH5_9ACTN|nr:hypothetical protein D5H78_03850 [Vallicoccus soli]
MAPGAGDDARRAQAARALLVAAHREHWGTVLAAVARTVGGPLGGDLGIAEEATQDAFVQALEAWPRDGAPERPAAWLTTVARRRALDRVRRDAVLRRRLPLLAVEADRAAHAPHGPGGADGSGGAYGSGGAAGAADDGVPDERLALVLACCHPALAPEGRVALTLRMVCGLSTAEVARAFLVSEPTMAARLTRAKRKVAAAGVPLRVPPPPELAARLPTVLDVVHLAATAGHTASTGDALRRDDLAARALDLARVLAVLVPRDPEVLGLLALLVLTEARAPARTDAQGVPVPLEQQDRALWDAGLTAEGLRHLGTARRALGRRRPGRHLLQAEVAAVHARAASYAATDWQRLLLLHDALCATWPSPVVRLARAAAVGLARGPEQGLAALDAVAGDERLRSYPYLPAARGEMLRRLGRREEAAAELRRALALQPSAAERRGLERRLAALGAPEAPRRDGGPGGSGVSGGGER